MARPKYSDAYPDIFKDILIRVGRDMQVVTLPAVGGYTLPSLRTSFYSFFKAVIREAEADRTANPDLQSKALWAKKCIVRIRDNKLEIAHRDNDSLTKDITAALEEFGFQRVDPLEDAEPAYAPLNIPPAAPRENVTSDDCANCGGYGCEKCTPATPAEPETKPADPDDRVRELAKRWLKD